MDDDDANAPVYEPFIHALFARFPDWRALSREEGTPAWQLLVEVPAPPEARVARDGLRIEADEEITVHFDWWHAHYGPGARYLSDCDLADPDGHVPIWAEPPGRRRSAVSESVCTIGFGRGPILRIGASPLRAGWRVRRWRKIGRCGSIGSCSWRARCSRC
jgi:hypothetical protein